MLPFDRVEHAHERANQAGVKFVISELDTALTFCRLAGDASSESLARIKISAKRSFDAAIYHVNSLILSIEERLAFEGKKEALSACLLEFGFVL
jgi:hypothetical protein